MLLGILALFMVVFADECTFNLVSTYGATTTTGALGCANAVAFSQSRFDATMAALDQLLAVYSFTDISSCKNCEGVEWNEATDLVAELGGIRAANYSTDYEWQKLVYALFARLDDAHTYYYHRGGYSQFFVIRPFRIVVAESAGTMKVYTGTEPSFSFGTWTAIATAAATGETVPTVSAVVGKEIVEINGVPALDYLRGLCDSFVSLYRSPGVRFNSLIKSDFVVQGVGPGPLMETPRETFTFADASNFSFPVTVLVYPYNFNSIATFTSILDTAPRPDPSAARKPGPYEIRSERMVRIPPELKPGDSQPSGELVARRSSYTPIASTAFMDYGRFVADSSATVMLAIVKTFSPTYSGQGACETFSTALGEVRGLIEYGQTNNITELLVLVSGNGGGYVCLSQAFVQMLFEAYADPAKAWFTLDYRFPAAQLEVILNIETGTRLVPCSMDTQTEAVWSASPQMHQRGAYSSPYTGPFMFDCRGVLSTARAYPAGCGTNWAPTFYFSKVVFVTDGTCGSACSQFVSKPVADGLATIASYGGFAGESLGTSSFCGGNVYTYSTWRSWYTNVSRTLPSFPGSAEGRFGAAEMYTSGAVPREFQSMFSSHHVSTWPVSGGAVSLTIINDVVENWVPQAPNVPTSISCTVPTPGDALEIVSLTTTSGTTTTGDGDGNGDGNGDGSNSGTNTDSSSPSLQMFI